MLLKVCVSAFEVWVVMEAELFDFASQASEAALHRGDLPALPGQSRKTM